MTEQEIIRIWNGYRLIFNGNTLQLDEKMIPIVKLKPFTDRQLNYARTNIKNILGIIPMHKLWIFAFVNSVATKSGLPYIYTGDITNSGKQSLVNNYNSYMINDHVQILENETGQYNDMQLQEMSTGFNPQSRLINLLYEGRISFISMMYYHTNKYPVDTSSINEHSLIGFRLKQIIEAAIYLEENYNFSEKFIMTQKHLGKIDG